MRLGFADVGTALEKSPCRNCGWGTMPKHGRTGDLPQRLPAHQKEGVIVSVVHLGDESGRRPWRRIDFEWSWTLPWSKKLRAFRSLLRRNS